MSNTTIILTILGIVIAIAVIVFFIVLLVHVKKNGGSASGSVSNGNNSISFTLTGEKPEKKKKNKKADDEEEEDDYEIDDQMKQFLDANLLKKYKFFTSTIHNYTILAHDFSIYDKLCAKNVKKEEQEVIEFKKIIAGKYLCDCLFKYLCNSLVKWVKDIEAECRARIAEKSPDSSIPVCYYSCLESLLKYKEETAKLARNIDIQFQDHLVHGIPEPFIRTLNDWSMKNINTATSSLSVIVYSATNEDWFMHVKEILDMYDIIFALIQNDVDATLVILNGEMKKYVSELLNKSFD